MNDLETSTDVFVQDDEVYGKKIISKPAPERKKDVDLKNTLYQNIIDAAMSSQLDLQSFESLNQSANDRNQLYNLIDTMCEDGSIAAVLETYAEDTTERNDAGNIIWVQSSDEDVSKYVEYLIDSLNINKNIFKWVYSLCKYGDVYLRLYRESEVEDPLFSPQTKKNKLNEDIKIKAYKNNDRYVHYIEMVENPAEIFELTKCGKTVGYIKAPISSGVITRQDAVAFSTFSYKFQKQDLTLYPATEFVHGALENTNSRVSEVVSIYSGKDDLDSDTDAKTYKVRRGDSLLAPVFKTWRELSLLEGSVLLNRLTKSSIVRLVNVEVGDMPKENVTKVLMNVKQMVEQKTALKTGSNMSEYTNPGPIENNVYVPTHGGIGTITTSQIGGDVDVKSLADLDYYVDKLYGQLRVPKQYFGKTDDSTGFNGGSSLSIISSRYAKMIKRIQNTIIQTLTDVINLMLIDNGLVSYVNNFRLQMLVPTTQEEIDRKDNMSNSVQLVSDIMNMLSEIEDKSAKLRILKYLLTNVIDNSEVITVIQEQIDSLEQENDEVLSNDTTETVEETSDIVEEPTIEKDLETKTDQSDVILPSPEELGVDLDDTEKI